MEKFNLMDRCLKYEALSSEKLSEVNKRLVEEIQSGNGDAFAELVMANSRLITSIMSKYACNLSYFDNADDLFQQGVLGLCDAAVKYDNSVGAAFSTYAYLWIRHYVLSYVAKNNLLSVPINIRNKSIAVNRFVAEYQAENTGQKPDDATICENVGISSQTLQEIRMCAMDVISLDAPISKEDEQGDIAKMDMLVASGDSVDEIIINDELHTLLLNMVRKAAKNNIRDFDIVVRYFGLNNDEPTTLNKLGTEYNISSERVRQIITNVIERMRKPQNLRMLSDYRG